MTKKYRVRRRDEEFITRGVFAILDAVNAGHGTKPNFPPEYTAHDINVAWREIVRARIERQGIKFHKAQIKRHGKYICHSGTSKRRRCRNGIHGNAKCADFLCFYHHHYLRYVAGNPHAPLVGVNIHP
jgi:hypothetical protein